MQCQSKLCVNEATTELQVKTNGMVAFGKDDEPKDGQTYELRLTKQCDEHAQEFREKFIIEIEKEL